MKQGETYVLTTGEYSDYGIRAIVTALREFDFDAAIAAYKATLPEHTCHYDERNGLIDYLLAQGLVAFAETVSELHVGDYGPLLDTPEADVARGRAEVAARSAP
jgi:hypothetical protein